MTSIFILVLHALNIFRKYFIKYSLTILIKTNQHLSQNQNYPENDTIRPQ